MFRDKWLVIYLCNPEMKFDCQYLANARHKYDDISCQYDINVKGKVTKKWGFEDKSRKAISNIIFKTGQVYISQMKIKWINTKTSVRKIA